MCAKLKIDLIFLSDLRDGFLNIVTALDLDGQRPSQSVVPITKFKKRPKLTGRIYMTKVK